VRGEGNSGQNPTGGRSLVETEEDEGNLRGRRGGMGAEDSKERKIPAGKGLTTDRNPEQRAKVFYGKGGGRRGS